VYTHSRRFEKIAAERHKWRQLEKSRNQSTESYAVHCPGVVTKVLTIVFDRRRLSPTRTHEPQRYHLQRGWQHKVLVLLLLLLLLITTHGPAVRTTAKDSRLPLTQCDSRKEKNTVICTVGGLNESFRLSSHYRPLIQLLYVKLRQNQSKTAEHKLQHICKLAFSLNDFPNTENCQHDGWTAACNNDC